MEKKKVADDCRFVMESVKKKPRLYEEVIQQIVTNIENGILKPGDRLPTERDLVSQLGVSRTSVREALRALELMGMIESKVKEGTFIRKIGIDGALLRCSGTCGIDDKSVLEMYDIRLQLETMSIRLASQNRTPAHLERMKSDIAEIQSDIDNGGRGQDGDNRFHMAVAMASGNQMLLRILSMCADVVNSSIIASNRYANVNVIVAEHTEMFDAIKEKDAKRAERLMRDHVKRACDRIKFLIKKAEKYNGESDA